MNLELREQVAKAMGHKRYSWPFLSDFADAWLVVEFMREKGYVLKLLDQRDHPTAPRWRADFRLDFTHDGDEAFWQGLAPPHQRQSAAQH